MITTDYEQQAIDFLTKTDTKLKIIRLATQSCPDWGEKCKAYVILNRPTVVIPHSHGFKYQVTLSRAGRKDLTFDFWSSINDSYSAEAKKVQKSNSYKVDDFWAQKSAKKPTAYDVLTCISGDIGMHDWTFEEFCSDFGYDTDSRQAEKTYNAVCDQSRALARLFNDEELDQLREIQ